MDRIFASVAAAGDTVEVNVAGIGALRNPVHAPQAQVVNHRLVR
jgi:hypothetical protein